MPNSTSSVVNTGSFYAENGTTYLTGSMYPNKKISNVTLSSGSYTLNESLTFGNPITQRIVLLGNYAYKSQSGFINETIVPVTANVMNLLNGVAKFYVPHIYQGDYQGFPTRSWPILITAKKSNRYWVTGNIKQPILELVPNQSTLAAGTMFWSEQYNGSNVTIRLIGTYSGGSSPPGDGFDTYLFINPWGYPWGWRVSSNYNYSILYAASDFNDSSYVWLGFNNGPFGIINYGIINYSSVQGDIILPISITPYIMVQWNSFWQTGYRTVNATGQFNIWIVNTIHHHHHYIISVYHWDGYGSGYFAPNPGDYICVTVTYASKTNTLYASAVDLNTGQIATAQVNLTSYFTPPTSGSYVFGVGGSTATADYANWGIVLVNYTNSK